YTVNLFDGLTPDILVMNPSSVRFGDISATDAISLAPLPGGASRDFKRNHLGYSGSLGLILKSDCSTIVILDEAFEAQATLDARLLIARALRRDALVDEGPARMILAGETGIRVRLDQDSTRVYCSALCGQGGFVQISSDFNQTRRSYFSRAERISGTCPDCVDWKRELGFTL
ncbi:MAG TPA: hypothetical protein VMX58_03360, partial [Patescibacteria group bacterium]|nr:hypothetical protein [Patescibacteria group bacterium]